MDAGTGVSLARRRQFVFNRARAKSTIRCPGCMAELPEGSQLPVVPPCQASSATSRQGCARNPAAPAPLGPRSGRLRSPRVRLGQWRLEESDEGNEIRSGKRPPGTPAAPETGLLLRAIECLPQCMWVLSLFCRADQRGIRPSPQPTHERSRGDFHFLSNPSASAAPMSSRASARRPRRCARSPS
jgi:hypothetical protein